MEATHYPSMEVRETEVALHGKMHGTNWASQNGQSIKGITAEIVVASILARPWFQCRWVIQELRLPRTEQKYYLMSEALCQESQFVMLLYRFQEVDQNLRASNLVHSAPAMLLDHDKKECANPHGYVYSLMHLWTAYTKEQIRVDYSRTVRETYLALMEQTALCIPAEGERQPFYDECRDPSASGEASEDASSLLINYMAVASTKKGSMES